MSNSEEKEKNWNKLHEGLAVENDVEEDADEIEDNGNGDGLVFENNYSEKVMIMLLTQ